MNSSRRSLPSAITTSLLLVAALAFGAWGDMQASQQENANPIIRESLTSFLHEGVSSTVSIDDFLSKVTIHVGGSTQNIAKGLIDLGKEQYRQGNMGSAVDYFKRALLIIDARDDKPLLCDTLKELGAFFKESGDNTNAIEYLSRAVDVSLLAVDETRLQELLKILEDLFSWQETVGKDPAKPPMPETPPAEPEEPADTGKTGKTPPRKPRTPKAPSSPVVQMPSAGDVLPCKGPSAPGNRAYGDLPVKPEWSRSHLNPVPGGKYAPYATDTGLDILASRGHPVYASMGGIILYSSPAGHCRQKNPWDDQGAVRIRHPNGHDTFYAHLSGRRASLARGTRVVQGQWVANVGTANRVPHLHYTIYYPGGGHEGPFTTPKKLLNPWPYKKKR